MAVAASLAAWPPAAGLSTVLVPRNETLFSVFGSSYIHAPAALVFNNIRNTTAYPEWNTFTPAANITTNGANAPGYISLGDTFTYIVVLNASDPTNTTLSPEIVRDISTPAHPSKYVSRRLLKHDGSFWPNLNKVYRAVWGDNNPAYGGALKTERFSEVIELGRKRSLYRTWENYGGPYANTVQPLQGELQEDFGIYARDLKGYSEKLYCESKHIGKRGGKHCGK
ncbi:MAG: hypothetical protein Q9191_001609 [Dirinaria sp. TL-2023a]